MEFHVAGELQLIKSHKGLDTPYMTQIHEQQCFTILGVAAGWHELMVLQYVACTNAHVDLMTSCSSEQPRSSDGQTLAKKLYIYWAFSVIAVEKNYLFILAFEFPQ